MTMTATAPVPIPGVTAIAPPELDVTVGSPPADTDPIMAGNASELLQPAISPIATRLASPATPQAEKVAILGGPPDGSLRSALEGTSDAVAVDSYQDQIQGEDQDRDQDRDQDQDSDSVDDGSPRPPRPREPQDPRRVVEDEAAARSGLAGLKPGVGGPSTSGEDKGFRFSNPWKFSRDSTAEGESPSKSAACTTMGSTFGGELEGFGGGSGGTRNRRSTSVGAEALRRFQKAFPSFSAMQLPSGIRNSIPASLFFSNDHKGSQTQTQTQTRTPTPTRSNRRSWMGFSPEGPSSLPSRAATFQSSPHATNIPTQPSRPRVLRRATSDDSLLYHTMSRTSLDDYDGRFDHVREMASVRMMAIRESLPERPAFRMLSLPSLPNLPSLPSLPNLPSLSKFPTPLRKSAHPPSEPGTSPAVQPTPPTSQPAPPANAADADTPTAPLDRVLETLTGDVVVLGGYRGSVLRDASPPHQQLWAPVKVGLNMRKVDLEVGLDPEDEENMEQRIIPSGMLQNIGPIDISRRLIRRMRGCDNAKSGSLRVWDYGYDWRLSPALLSRKLEEYLEKLPCNQVKDGQKKPEGAWVIAHSLGGMITRHVVNRRPELFAGVVYVGVPQRAVNILGPLRNGDAVLLNEKILTARVNFSLRTSFAFLPEDGFCFVDRDTGEDLRIDFYNVEDWIKYRLSPCVEEPLPVVPKPTLGSLLPSLPLTLPLRRKDTTKASERRATIATPSIHHPPTTATSSSFFTTTFSSSASPHPSTTTTSTTTAATSSTSSMPPSPTSPRRPSSPDRAERIAYLSRTLAAIKQFRAEIAFRPTHADANAYPPLALMYGRDVPTVFAARVAGREAIGRADMYDDLVFRGGDGVVLAREAMLPEGYALVKGGKVLTERGHVTILGDLAGVGRALGAVVRGRRKGVGLGVGDK